MSDVTRLLQAISPRDWRSSDELLKLVYDELRRLAAVKLANEAPGQTLDATGLVHEAYLRLVGARSVSEGFDNRNHFFAAASEAMRRILIDRARARKAAKRGGGQRVPVELDQLVARFDDDELIEIDSLLDALAEKDAEAAELVRLHVFGGLSIEETAAALGTSRATAYRNWNYARAWLREAIPKNS